MRESESDNNTYRPNVPLLFEALLGVGRHRIFQ